MIIPALSLKMVPLAVEWMLSLLRRNWTYRSPFTVVRKKSIAKVASVRASSFSYLQIVAWERAWEHSMAGCFVAGQHSLLRH